MNIGNWGDVSIDAEGKKKKTLYLLRGAEATCCAPTRAS